jgi:hypothetical protein
VNGFSNDDVTVFGEVYKKAKQIGANSFSLKPIENVDGTFKNFNLDLLYSESFLRLLIILLMSKMSFIWFRHRTKIRKSILITRRLKVKPKFPKIGFDQ